MASIPTTVPNIGPQTLVVNGVYIFNNFTDLVVYIRIGTKLQIAPGESLESELAQSAPHPLRGIYGDIKTHCTAFRDGPLQQMGVINSNISAYAAKVGSSGAGSYAEMFANIQLLADEKDKDPTSALAQSLQATVTKCIDDLIQSVLPIKSSTDSIISSLTSFETQCATDAMALQRYYDVNNPVATHPGETWDEYLADVALNGELQIQANTPWLQGKIPIVIHGTQLLKGAVDALSNELSEFQTYVDNDVRTVHGIFTTAVQNNLSDQWSEIATLATAFSKSISA
ncbi:hypothetical protein B0H15DRAFT_579991 [Mycena belliarum]|uniref:Uncharacterized protein n=1 Tax=Mycena belliarum TaxID=1033014 RepID=A0AAD6UCH5_9AGAR|nr:hypothetical protein B0H15DRAFT_579991 [Mycena belliae]